MVILINLMAMAGFLFMVRRPMRGAVEILPPPTTTPAPTSTPVRLTIHVSGAVVKPGVYTLSDGSRVQQAVDAAGGLSHNAAEAGVNLAQPLVDGQQIYVPHEGETAPPVAVRGPSANASSSGGSGEAIDINTATLEELTVLPGIGPTIAGRIVEYRESNGSFRTIEDIKQVRGIGEATFEDLADLITVH